MAEYWGFMPHDGKPFFISYNSQEWEHVAPVAKALSDSGVPVWYDYGLEVGTDSWREQISGHIENCYAVIVFVTAGVFERDNSYVYIEYSEAVKLKKTVIPVFLDDIRPEHLAARYRSYLVEWENMPCVPYVSETPKKTAGRIEEIIRRNGEISFASGESEPENAVLPSDSRVRKKRGVFAGIAVTAVTLAAALLFRIFFLPGIIRRQTIRVGDHVSFGSYIQTADREMLPIEWRVLDIQDGNALLITEYLLDCAPYYTATGRNTTWETSTLRQWLNETFYRSAFSEKERRAIRPAATHTPDNPIYGTDGGSDAEDRVFCLSLEEAEAYFTDSHDRMAGATEYALLRGAYTRDYCSLSDGTNTSWWWLRTPGEVGQNAALVSYNGSVNSYGNVVNNNVTCVRPAIIVPVSSVGRMPTDD